MPRRSTETRRIRWLEGLGLVVAVCAFYHPYLNPRTLTTGGDMANLFFPVFGWVGDVVREQGVWPLWNPYGFGGHPGAAAAQSAVFYPPARAIYALFGKWPVAAMNLFLLAHLVWAALGAWAFTRSRSGLSLRGAGPFCAGLGFACSAWWWGQVEHAAALATASWLPWLTWSAGILAARRSIRSVGIVAIVFAIQLTAGHPQEAFYSLLAAAAWCAWRAWRSGGSHAAPRLHGQFRTLAAAACAFAAACFLAACIAAVQLIPTLELSRHSYRQFDTPSYAAHYSLPPALLRLAVSPHAWGNYAEGYKKPYAFNEYGIYMGIPLLLLALAGWVQGRFRRRPGSPARGATALWAAVAAGAILLALGGHADLRKLVAPDRVVADRPAEFPAPGWSPLALLIEAVPPVRHFRVPARILLLWSFAISLLAAHGIRYMEYGIRNRGRAWHSRRTAGIGVTALAVLCGALIFMTLYVPSRKERLAFQADYKDALTFARDDRPEIPGDAPLDNRLFRLTLLDDELLARDAAAPVPGDTSDLGLEERVAVRASIFSPNLNLPAGRSLVQGYEEGLLPIVRYKDFLFRFNRSFRGENPDARLLAVGGARWLWSELPVRSPDWEAVGPVIGRRGIGRLYRNRLWRGAAFDKSAFPAVQWDRLEGPFHETGQPALERATQRVPYTDTNATDARPAAPENFQPQWTIELVTVNSLVVRPLLDSISRPAEPLIVAQAVYPGWVARDADGRRLPVRALNAWNLEIDLKGQRRPITLAYEPWSFRLGAFLSALGLAAALALLTPRIRPRKAPNSESPPGKPRE